ncbi:TonB-dependent receptor plug domain-containing protein [Methylocaldum sp. MU1018]
MVKTRARRLIGPAAAVLVTLRALAAPQEEATELPTVTVAPAEDLAAIADDRLSATLANHVTIRSRTDLESSQYSNVDNFLRGTPGVFVTRSSEGRGSGLRVRGASAAQGMVTFDGVPLLTALPALSWLDTIPAEALGGVAAVLGSNHAYYSGQALGGSIQMHSKRAVNDYGLAHAEGGSFGTFRTTLSGGVQAERADIAVAASRINQFDGTHDAMPERGNPERDPFGSSLGMTRYGARFAPDLTVDGSLLYKDSWQDADLPGVTSAGLPTFVDSATTHFHEKLWLTQNAASVRLTDDWTSRLQLAYTQNDVAARAGGLPIGFRSHLMFADWRNSHALFDDRAQQRHWRLIWGGQARHERGESENPLRSSQFRDERKTVTGFAEVQADLGRWHHEAGVRVESHDDYGKHTLMHFGSRWDLAPALSLSANAGTAFRAPGYGELQMPLLGNPALRPEKGLTADAGFDWMPTRDLRLAVTGYYGRYNDLVTSEIGLGRFFSIGNTPRARIAGVEASLETLWSEQIRSGVDFTYQYSRNLDNDRPLPVHPEKSGRAWAQWDMRVVPLSLRVNAIYQSAQWNDIAATLPSREAVRVDVLATCRVLSKLNFYVRGENLTGNRDGGTYAHHIPGATVFGGFHLKL